MEHIIKINSAPTMNLVRDTRQELAGFLSSMAIERVLHDQIILAFTEIVTNIVKYSAELPRNIEIVLQCKTSLFIMDIRDNGTPFHNINTKMASLPSDIDFADMGNGGLGLFIIKQYFSEYNYISSSHSNDNYNHFVISKGLEHKPQILLVEDDDFSAEIITKCIDSFYDVHHETNIQGALDYVKDNNVDLIISDIYLKNETGISLREHLQYTFNTTTIPFVFLTGNDDASIEALAFSMGIDDYLVKPIDGKLLLRTIRRVLQHSSHITSSISNQINDKASGFFKPHLPTTLGSYKTELFTKEAEAGGGDIVISYKLEGRDIVILADVKGHGMEAKTFVNFYAAYFNGLLSSMEKDTSISQIMFKLNNMIVDDENINGNYLTCKIIELRNDGINICTAGHPTALLIKTGEVVDLKDKGVMPGIEHNQLYQVTNISLEQNDKLFLYTDGLIEGNCNDHDMKCFNNDLNDMFKSGDTKVPSIMSLYNDHFNSVVNDDITFFTIQKG